MSKENNNGQERRRPRPDEPNNSKMHRDSNTMRSSGDIKSTNVTRSTTGEKRTDNTSKTNATGSNSTKKGVRVTTDARRADNTSRTSTTRGDSNAKSAETIRSTNGSRSTNSLRDTNSTRGTNSAKRIDNTYSSRSNSSRLKKRIEETNKPIDFEKRRKKKRKLTPLAIFGRVMSFVGITLAAVLILVIGVCFILLKGPSESAAKLFTLSCNETSAMKWLPKVFLSNDEYEAILNPVIEGDDYVEFALASTDYGVVDIGNSDEDISSAEVFEIIDIKGPTYKGKMMLVHDPSLVSFASINSFGGAGITLKQFLDRFDAIACTNAGGFMDEGGKGAGGTPDGIVIRDGKIVYGSAGGYYGGVAGFDANHKLIVGRMSGQQALDSGIVSGTSFSNGPTLIKDGVKQSGFNSGINPRTAVGQTADGTVILLAIEGRLADSLGATFYDLADIMENYGAINATNMDGGSSSGLYYEGERLTRSSSVVGDRPLPTAIIVARPE